MASGYAVRYLPLFYEDLEGAFTLLADESRESGEAVQLAIAVESAILERIPRAEGVIPYHSKKKRSYPYYLINVGNDTVFYVVIDNVVEIRRFIHRRRDAQKSRTKHAEKE